MGIILVSVLIATLDSYAHTKPLRWCPRLPWPSLAPATESGFLVARTLSAPNTLALSKGGVRTCVGPPPSSRNRLSNDLTHSH